MAGLSAQPIGEQAEFAERMHIAFPLVNDEALSLADAMGLPTFAAGGHVLYKRVTMLVRDDTVERVWYPVFPPNENAAAVLAHLSEIAI